MISKEKKAAIAAFISSLDGKNQLNLCPECHKLYGCGHEHSYLLYGEGKCSVCGKEGKAVNCAIANRVVKEGIDLVDYWREGKKLC